MSSSRFITRKKTPLRIFRQMRLTLLPSVFITRVHPPSPHPKSPIWQRTVIGLEPRSNGISSLPHYQRCRTHILPPAGRFETSRAVVCRRSGTNNSESPLVACSAGVLSGRANVISSQSFIRPVMFDLEWEWTVGVWGVGRAKSSLPHPHPSLSFWPSNVPLVQIFFSCQPFAASHWFA